MTDTINAEKPVASVPLPSADLINYRFDQADKQFEKLNKKLDNMTSTFATNTYVAQLVKDSGEQHKGLQKQIDDIKRNAKWWVGTILTISGLAVGVISIIK